MFLLPSVILALVAVTDARSHPRRNCRVKSSVPALPPVSTLAPPSSAVVPLPVTTPAIVAPPVITSAAPAPIPSSSPVPDTPEPAPQESEVPQNPDTGSNNNVPEPAVLYESSGDFRATYYYDVDRVDVCQKVQGEGWSDGINTALTKCASLANPMSLADINSNSIVAINHTMMDGNEALYCGKQVQIFDPSGNEVVLPDGPFFIWDSCAACMTQNIIDVSALAAVTMNGGVCDNPTGLSWKILDNVVRPYGS